MARFDPTLWRKIIPRLVELRAGMQPERFVALHNLMGIKWRAIEANHQGLSVESLHKLCLALDVSPSWVIFGLGPKKLSALASAASPKPYDVPFSRSQEQTAEVREEQSHAIGSRVAETIASAIEKFKSAGAGAPANGDNGLIPPRRVKKRRR